MLCRHNNVVFRYNRKAPLCIKPQETAWLFHEIGNCFLAMKIFEYAHESGLKSLKAAAEAGSKRLQLQTNVLVAVSEGRCTTLCHLVIFTHILRLDSPIIINCRSPLSYLGASGVNFNFHINFDENPLSKQNSHRWDTAFCGVTSVAILFAYTP